MAKAKQDSSGIEHFEEAARVMRETSTSSRFSATSQAPTTGRDGIRHVEERGEPKAGVKPPDED